MGDTTGRQNVRFPGGDGEAFGYLRLPETGSGPGVVVIQEWWGLTTHVASSAASAESWVVGAIGFCMGGGFVFALAARRPSSCSPRAG